MTAHTQETAMAELNVTEIDDVSGALKVCYAPRPWWPWLPF